ncbi:hypothetical protein L550_3144 [Bordetella pertussis H973]|uniref:Uncharacterized protein n=1 Tax=Bordetella pertussis CHLA-26 TaxID=1331284 RepID=A0AAI9J123_BORPT|nr:hypothetical protein V483_0664 [Bordetella pertussis CHLA-11]ETH12559.1 hypothetical protein L574_1053 [Bordetella pertussis STO1-SEAT-0006]ETH17684.1 hypothetical protein L575_0262 [Bordetella pertussis STO1-SEAT-0007]ETH21410.1 hypothetical protein L563_0506 [Bordetella pertussis CHLA-13]ETH27341.1 hypothetical protein L565_0606 [Bordetella pertussis CHLA-20]ETH30530.1 hypothetical protein L566_3014 [Bordetella pertussis CHLA-26]ETH43308.1 hypothetical protein L549_0798 [Bordetella pertu
MARGCGCAAQRRRRGNRRGKPGGNSPCHFVSFIIEVNRPDCESE